MLGYWRRKRRQIALCLLVRSAPVPGAMLLLAGCMDCKVSEASKPHRIIQMDKALKVGHRKCSCCIALGGPFEPASLHSFLRCFRMDFSAFSISLTSFPVPLALVEALADPVSLALSHSSLAAVPES